MEEESPRIALLKKQTAEVTEIARENVRKVVARGDDLDDLQHRADNLRLSAQEFDTSATRLKREMCWQSIKLWIVLLIVLLVILITLIVSIAVVASNKKK